MAGLSGRGGQDLRRLPHQHGRHAIHSAGEQLAQV